MIWNDMCSLTVKSLIKPSGMETAVDDHINASPLQASIQHVINQSQAGLSQPGSFLFISCFEVGCGSWRSSLTSVKGCSHRAEVTTVSSGPWVSLPTRWGLLLPLCTGQWSNWQVIPLGCNEFVLNEVVEGVSWQGGGSHKHSGTHLHVSDLQHGEGKAVQVRSQIYHQLCTRHWSEFRDMMSWKYYTMTVCVSCTICQLHNFWQ